MKCEWCRITNSVFYTKYSALLFFIIFMMIGALIWGWWINYNTNKKHENALFDRKVETFINKGRRFTADYGQDLCLRVQRLEESSDGRIVPLPCEYDREIDP